MDNATPMLRQYLEIKKRYPGTILFFRLGDFYEMFNEDALIGSRELEITLTARQKESKNPIPMCGVPYHAAANYISRLVKKGYRVAICEQTENATRGTKLVKRDVVRVITPGTAIESQMVNSKIPTYLAAIAGTDQSCSAAFLDTGIGEFYVYEFTGGKQWEDLAEVVKTFDPREIVIPASLQPFSMNTFQTTLRSEPLLIDAAQNGAQTGSGGDTLTVAEADYFEFQKCYDLLCEQFGTHNLSAFGLENKTSAVQAAGACLRYVRETQRSAAGHISEIRLEDPKDFLVLDSVTLRNLEIVESGGDEKTRTLLDVVDETITSMGSRILRSWLIRPSLKRTEIQTRHAAVTELSDSMLRGQLRSTMRGIADLERLVGRINLGAAAPRDLVALKSSLCKTPLINALLSESTSLLIQVLAENIFELPDICKLIETAIVDEPPANLLAGAVIRAGFSEELDALRSVSSSGKQSIASFEEQERARSGISNLKVRYNNVFGYYIEVSKGNLAKVPSDFERRQTLVSAERFTTPQLKEWEKSVLGAEERIVELERKLFESVLEDIRKETQKLQSTARALATLDALAGFAETAAKRNYVCPILHDGDEIKIKNSRHPIVEAYAREAFIPNDIYLNNSTDRLLIVTGANMGGKSTVLRQVALIQILAQAGSFVPASAADLPIVDRVWTRVGASDDLASGRSTFMVEMSETAAILHNSTPRSLILLDEIGRGTSTFDGLSIAWAVAEYLHNSTEHAAKTMFATHYHELTELADSLSGARNYQITATEKDDEIVFLHKLQIGKASKSYGIAVARLAGLPKVVIERAKEVLAKLEQYELAVFSDKEQGGLGKAAAQRVSAQYSLFAISNESVIDGLRSLDLDRISGDDATAALRELQSKIV